MKVAENKKYALKAVLGYAVASAAWIFFSDAMLARIADPATLTQLGTFKGLFYVVMTSILLYLAFLRLPATTSEHLDHDGGTSRAPMLALAAAMITILVISTVTFRAAVEEQRHDHLRKLRVLTTLEAQGLGTWVSERAARARAMAGDGAFLAALERRTDPAGPIERGEVARLLKTARQDIGFAAAALVDRDGRTLAGDAVLGERAEDVAAALREGVSILPPVRSADGPPHVRFVVPVPPTRRGSDVAAVVVDQPLDERIDAFVVPAERLEPSFESILISARTGEPILLRGGTTTALPLEALIAAAAKSESTAVTMLDGNQTPVMTAAHRVPGTDWTLISRHDEADSLVGLNHLALTAGLSLGVAFIACIGLAHFLWSRQRIKAAMKDLMLQRATVAAEDRYRATFEQVAVGIVHIDTDGRILRLNPAFVAITGHTADELMKIGILAVFTPDDRVQVARSLARFSAGEVASMTSQRRIVRPDGTLARVRIAATLIRSASGETPTPYLVAIIEDVSELEQAQADLRRAAAVFTNTQEGVVITDPRGTIVEVNPAFSTITGWRRSEAIGKPISMVKSGRQDATFYRAMWRSIEETGSWQGEIWNRRRSGEIFPQWLTISTVFDADGSVLHRLGTFTDIGPLKTSQERLTHLALHDHLTDLPNRVLLVERLDRAIEQIGSDDIGAVMFLDLDRFKTVNDSLGHAAGDELLQAVAQRLGEVLPEGATLARLGGDEFVGLLPRIAAPEEAAAVARAWVARFDRGFELAEGPEIWVSASVGITLFPTQGNQADKLLQQADAALYVAKAAGGNTHHFYDAEMTEAASRRLELEVGLRRALDADEFELHHQPLVSIDDGRVRGVEALVRWRHPTRGLTAPDVFLPLAEETGLIVRLGDWVMENACRQMKTWLEDGVPLETIAVNLTPREFQRPDLPARIAATLMRTGLAAHHLEIEITEGALMEQGPVVDANLAALKALGVKLAVDDFGTGYSSLSYLRQMPIDKLKIDRSFVRDLETDPASGSITSAIVTLARTLELEVLAEGVETQGQFEVLRAMGCDTVQGYLFARPVPAAEIPGLLAVMAARAAHRFGSSDPRPLRRVGEA